ncbi:hypothetical protein GGI43DRAFT_403069 [Trichoderma evansii]
MMMLILLTCTGTAAAACHVLTLFVAARKSPASHCMAWDARMGLLKHRKRATGSNDLQPQRLSLPLPHHIRSASGEHTQQQQRPVTVFRAGGAPTELGFCFGHAVSFLVAGSSGCGWRRKLDRMVGCCRNTKVEMELG